jgi:hypothetical protein
MYCTNYHRANQNIKTCRSKKEEPIVVATKATTQVGKPPRLLNYPCHIFGIVGHKLTNCPRFNEMQSTFKDKTNQSTKFKPIAEVKTLLPQLTWWMSMLPLIIKQMKNKCLKTKNQGRTNLQQIGKSKKS